MNRVSVWIAVVAGIACFVGGFLFANFLNRSELTDLRGANERLRTDQNATAKTAQEITLSDGEITAKLVEAEQNASNFTFQKNLGLGLYRYGAIKQDKTIIEKAVPVLMRAYDLNAGDYDVLVGLGNAYYDIGYFGKDNPSFAKSREFYSKALAKKPDDIEVRTDLGLTYFLQDPPDHNGAVIEFERSLAINPKHEKTLGFIVISLRNQNKDFSKYAEQLRSVNPNNPSLKEIAGTIQ